MPLLTTGNSAKVYCLQWIERAAQGQESVRILDLGSGTSNNFRILLEQYPQVQYVGVEPDSGACEVARQTLPPSQTTIINDYAYDIMGRIVHEPFDVVVSFSVMEHVVQRQRYLDSAAACLKDTGSLLINYDAGHFVYPKNLKERAKNIIGPLLARFGVERYYQRFVREDDFRRMVHAAKLKVVDAKSFNTQMKGIHKQVPEAMRDEHMQRWLDYELWLNEVGTPYSDDQANLWVTRNFVLQKQ